MDIYLAEESAFHYIPQVTLEVAQDRMEQKKVQAVSGTLGALFSRAKPEEIQSSIQTLSPVLDPDQIYDDLFSELSNQYFNAVRNLNIVHEEQTIGLAREEAFQSSFLNASRHLLWAINNLQCCSVICSELDLLERDKEMTRAFVDVVDAHAIPDLNQIAPKLAQAYSDEEEEEYVGKLMTEMNHCREETEKVLLNVLELRNFFPQAAEELDPKKDEDEPEEVKDPFSQEEAGDNGDNEEG